MNRMLATTSAALMLVIGTAAQAQVMPSSPEEIAGVMAEVRAWRQIADHGWAKTYFGTQEATPGPNRHFLTSDLHNEPQDDRVDPSAGQLWGYVFEREYDCGAQRTRIVKTLTLRIDTVELDDSDLDWVPRSEIVVEDGQTAFALACA